MTKPRRRDPWSARRVALLVMTMGLAIIAAGHIHQHGWHWTGLIDDVYSNFGSELTDMAIAVLLIDGFAERRERERLRRQLVRELGSTDAGLTARAVLELEAHGWLYDGTLTEAQLSGANLADARLERALLARANLAGANLTRTNLSGASLAQANFAGATLERANIEMADLTGARLPVARLHRTDAALARLTGATLNGADLTEADLSGADLTGADLRGARLVNSRLGGAVLTDARWDAETRWPDGFTPPTFIPQGEGQALTGRDP